MEKREDGEGITERPVDDVPEVENLLGAREKKDALGERGLPPCDPDGLFQMVVPRGQQPAERKKPGSETGSLKAKKRNLKGSLEIEENHPEQH